jgi:hypothetical protein
LERLKVSYFSRFCRDCRLVISYWLAFFWWTSYLLRTLFHIAYFCRQSMLRTRLKLRRRQILQVHRLLVQLFCL